MYSNPGTDGVQSKNDYYVCETYSLSKPINLKRFWDWKIFFAFNSYKFKATELNHKIFECNGTLGVYMIPKKPNTEAEPFHFHSEDRAEVHKTKEKPSSEVYNT